MQNFKININRVLLTILALAFVTSLFSVSFDNPNTLNKNQNETAYNKNLIQLPDFVTLSKKVSPSVVNISTLVKPKPVNNPFNGQRQIPLPDIFRHFFDMQPPPSDEVQPQAQPNNKNIKPIPRSLGSGFILSSDGYILTNNHVVKDADEILVRLKDRREYKAKLIGADEKTDIALLKIDAKNLPAVTMGNSENLDPGQWVFAIGSPFGFSYSVTKGIISALNRSLPNETYVPFIQTDVPINPGNSGGPLLDMNGKVIGINSQILTRSGGFMGLSFAIPVDEANYVITELKKHGKVTRGWLGVIFQNVDQALAQSFNLKKPEGALVSQVIPNSPAAKAGLQPGDIILKVDSNKVEFYNDLPVIIGRTPVNAKIDITLWRNGKMLHKITTIEKKPEDDDDYLLTSKNKLGLSVETLDEKWRQQLNLQDSVTGVVVTQTPNSGIGADLELLKNDVITQFDNNPIHNADEFNKTITDLNSRKGEISVAVRIIRQGQPIFKAFSFHNKK